MAKKIYCHLIVRGYGGKARPECWAEGTMELVKEEANSRFFLDAPFDERGGTSASGGQYYLQIVVSNRKNRAWLRQMAVSDCSEGWWATH